ncbi:ATP-binding protein [Pontibacter toksunensis]|uniref:histidine kinase n=1 Tax=Pontibacter toksunensis TaxID=1332631 RepID=A0ABW6BQY8_9BACT
MEWFQLRPQSIAALAEFTLCLTLAMYLLSIKNKSSDGLLITGMFILHTIYNAISFLRNSAFGTDAYEPIVWVHSVVLVFLGLYNLLFCYTYRYNPYPRETKVALLVSFALMSMGMYFHQVGYPWTFPVQLLLAIWFVIVFVRKATLSARVHVETAGATGSVPPGGSLHRWSAILQELMEPSTRDTKAYRAFAFWCILLVVAWLNANLGIFRITSTWWEPVHHAIYLILITGIVINYMTYAQEKTTFLAKLVGLFMCLTLIVLGMLGFMLYGNYNEVGVADVHTQNALRYLAYLIPISTLLIVLVFPPFFRNNLLRPLNYVLEGVKRVNAGELKVEVPIEVQDEIGALARHFNLMTESLRRYAEQMESLVAQRTAELERKSKELEQQKMELQQTLDNLKSTQAQLVQSEKMASLGELTAGVAHEIQNPLNFINNFSEVSAELVEELRLGPAQQLQEEPRREANSLLTELAQNLSKIYTHGLRADSIVKGMLQHSRKSLGHKESTDINAFVNEYLRISYHGLRAKDKTFTATVVTDYDDEVGKAEIIPQDLGRVLVNLLNNAYYAVQTKQKKEGQAYEPLITVSTHRLSDAFEIRVKDNGTGISKEAMNRVFQPFFTTKPTGQGTGLGLSLSHDIVTKGHGGKLYFETAEGQYTEFIIQVPVAHVDDKVLVSH